MVIIIYNYYFESAHAPGDQQQISGGPDVYETRVLKRPVETDRGGTVDDYIHVGDHELFVGPRKTHIRFRAIATDEQHFFDELRFLVPQSREQLQKSVIIATVEHFASNESEQLTVELNISRNRV